MGVNIKQDGIHPNFEMEAVHTKFKKIKDSKNLPLQALREDLDQLDSADLAALYQRRQLQHGHECQAVVARRSRHALGDDVIPAARRCRCWSGGRCSWCLSYQ